MYEIVEKFGKPGIDLFASRIRRQLDRYLVYNTYFHIFPFFSLK